MMAKIWPHRTQIAASKSWCWALRPLAARQRRRKGPAREEGLARSVFEALRAIPFLLWRVA